MLISVTILYFLSGSRPNARPVQMLMNNFLRYIHSWMKEIGMVPIQCVTLEYWNNNNCILTHYTVNIYITYSTKRTFSLTYGVHIYPLCWGISIDIFVYFSIYMGIYSANSLVLLISDTIYYL